GRIRLEAGENADQCRLAATRRADHADELAAVYLKIDVLERSDRPLRGIVVFVEILHIENDGALLQFVETCAYGVGLFEIAAQLAGVDHDFSLEFISRLGRRFFPGK